MDNDKKLFNELLKADDIDPAGPTEAERDSFAKLLDQQSKMKKTKPGPVRPNIWRIIIKSRITKFAAAAVIIVAVMIGINQFGGLIDGASVAWADITEKVNQIHTYTYKLHATFTAGPKGPRKMESEAYFSSEHGLRSDMYMDGKLSMIQHLDLANKRITGIMPEQKKYMNMQLTDERLQDMNQKGNGDPRYLIEQFLSLEYTELGPDVIDGVEVEGIETADPRYSGGMFDGFIGSLWVDVETDLPVRLEMQMQMPSIAGKDLGTVNMVMDSFQWDVDIDSVIFEPNIPPDYTSMGDIKIPASNEQNTVEGLRLFAEMSKGKYPKKLNVMTVMGEVTKIMKENRAKTYGQNDPNYVPSAQESEEIQKILLKKLSVVQGACLFYAELVTDNKEPAYYGDLVTADDADTVLMRWKVNDGQYRVIFGDLTIENITAEQLAELERQLTQ